ncbi:MAG: phospholipase, partial [Bacteroidaceae bacterium]|nr:phospholipase [Bacteroidaceae bacterium]
EVNPVDMECCGQHEVCEKESLLAAISKQVEYYNDEELDRFRGRRPEDYSEAEADEFRDVLYTMRDDEVAGWVRSLQLRFVELPEALKDEVFLIVGERRGQ